MDYYSTIMYASLPAQKQALSKKGKDWRENCVEAIASMGQSRFMNGRTTWARKQVNYDLVNSIFSQEDFQYVLDPYGLGTNAVGQQPAKMRDINLIVNKLNLLKGEEMTRRFDFEVVALNGNAVSWKEEERKNKLMEVAMQEFQQAAGLLAEQDPNLPAIGDFDKWANKSLKDIREEWGSHILRYLTEKEELPLKFNNGWEHVLIAAEEIYYIGITNGQPKVRVCNPVNCEFDRNPDNPSIEDGDWFKEDRWMTANQILDEYNEYLTEEQVKMLDSSDVRRNLTNQMFPGFGYSESDIDKYERGNFTTRTRNNNTHYLVTHVVWKSMKQIGFVSYPDENGEIQSGIVDETFNLTPEMKEMGYTVEWRWIPEWWHGTKIASSFYAQIEPLPYQMRSMDNPSEVKGPYVGRIYNATNSIQTSLVDLLKPHQYLYNIIWFRLEAEIAKAKGKKMVMDVAMIPKSEGIDMDKWMYYFDNVGIAFINSFEEGKDKFQGQVSNFNQFQNIDMALSQSVGQYIQILGKIEQLMDKICGITPQREGSTSATETASGVERSVSQSSQITEPWFYMHNDVKKKVLTQLVEVSKFAYEGSKKINYILDDVERIFMEIDFEKFSDSDYGVFISNNSRDTLILSKLENLAAMALQTDKASFSDVIKMYKSSSISELAGLIEQSEKERAAEKQQEQQGQMQMQQQMIQAQAQEKQADRAFQAEQNQLDRENDIQVAALKTAGFDEDTQGNGQIDVIKEAELMIKQGDMNRKAGLEHRKIDVEVSEGEKNRQLEREKLKSKEKIEDKKAKVQLKNKVSGEK